MTNRHVLEALAFPTPSRSNPSGWVLSGERRQILSVGNRYAACRRPLPPDDHLELVDIRVAGVGPQRRQPIVVLDDLDQRIAVRYSLAGMTPADTADYIGSLQMLHADTRGQ